MSKNYSETVHLLVTRLLKVQLTESFAYQVPASPIEHAVWSNRREYQLACTGHSYKTEPSKLNVHNEGHPQQGWDRVSVSVKNREKTET